jgi:uncharacterized protein
MKTKRFLLLLLLIQVFTISGQVKPDKVDLYSHGSLLHAFFYQNAEPGVSPVVILLHGWPGNADNPLGLAPKICAGGIHVLVFNYRGTWGSEGYTSLKSSAEDIPEAIRFLKQKSVAGKYRIDTASIFIAGYSYGGGAMMTAAIHYPEVKNLISIAGADMSVFIRMLRDDQQFRSGFEERTKKQNSEGGFSRIDGDIGTFTNEMISNVDYFDPVKNADLLKDRKILFIVGWDDLTGKMEDNALPLYRNLKKLNAPDVSITAFADNHSFVKSGDEVARAIVEWVSKRAAPSR